MKKPELKATRKTDTTKLTITITEDSFGAFDVETHAVSVENNTPVPMRPSHVVGQLVTAAFFYMADHYSELKQELQDLSKAKK